jgi:hypothetical protein
MHRPPDRYQHFLQTVLAARTRDLDDLLGQVWGASREGRLTDIEAQQLAEVGAARRTLLQDRRRAAARNLARQKPINGMRPLVQAPQDAERTESIRRNRAKVFGLGRPKPMSAQNKKDLMRRARALLVPTEPGKHYGKLTPKYVTVLEKLLYVFHNNKLGGACFPSYEAIAEEVVCARSTVGLALRALEEAELLTWDHRLKREFETVVDLFGAVTRGQRSRVERASNAYTFFFEDTDDDRDRRGKSSKSENNAGPNTSIGNQILFLAMPMPAPVPDPEKARLDVSRKWLEERKPERR